MPRENLDAHPSVVIAYFIEAMKFLMSIYDQGYPKKTYRGSANNIGGNPEPEDINPENLLIKEIIEEFNPNHSIEKMYVGKVDWASDSDIREVRSSLISRVQPVQDFIVRQPGVIEGGNTPYKAIYSVFYTQLPPSLIECIEENLKKGKSLITEGDCGIFTLEDLENSPKKEFSAAHATAHILNWKFGSKIPHPKGISAEPIGLPRKSYNAYLPDFKYDNEALERASKAEDFHHTNA